MSTETQRDRTDSGPIPKDPWFEDAARRAFAVCLIHELSKDPTPQNLTLAEAYRRLMAVAPEGAASMRGTE